MSRSSSSYRSIFAARARPQQQTRRLPLLLSIDGTDRQTDGRTLDRFMTLTAYCADREVTDSNKSKIYDGEIKLYIMCCEYAENELQRH